MIQIYFAFNSKARRMKIGSTANSLHERVRSIGMDRGEKLEIIAAIPTLRPDAEVAVQFHFKSKLITGSDLGHEWFSIGPREVLQFAELWASNSGETVFFDYYGSISSCTVYAPERTKGIPEECVVPNCKSLQMSNGICRRHYMRFARRVSRGRATWEQLDPNRLDTHRRVA